MQPWICPRCQRVNAPWAAHCDCPAPPTTTTTDGPLRWYKSPSSTLVLHCPTCGGFPGTCVCDKTTCSTLVPGGG